MAIVWVECWKCELCGHRWIKTGDAPRLCSKCKKTGWNKNGNSQDVPQAAERGLVVKESQGVDDRARSIQQLGAASRTNPHSVASKPVAVSESDLRSICAGKTPHVDVEQEKVEDVTPKCCECDKSMTGKVIKGVVVAWACTDAGCPMYGLEQKGCKG